MNRYYASQWGRFLSPDPYGGSARLGAPQTWNRYMYVLGDPVNSNDPPGLDDDPTDYQGPAIFSPDPEGGDDGPILGPAYFGSMPTLPALLFFVAPVQNAKERAALKVRIKRLGNCTKILGGASASDFLAVANSIQYFDGSPGAPGSGRSQSAVSGNGVGLSLAATVQYDVADTLLGSSNTPIPYVVLGTDFYNDPTVSQSDVLLHEALHVALGLGDANLKSYLSQYGFVPGYGGTGGTDDITQWLKANCPDQPK